MTEPERSQNRGEAMPRSGVRGFSSSVLRMARADAGLRADELGRLLGVTQQAVAMWETGKSKPTPAMLAALARTLRVSAADLAPIREADLRIGDLRAQAGLTQVQVAKHLQVAAAIIGNMERGFRVVNDKHVPVLAELYGVSEDRVRSIWRQTYDAVTERLNTRK
jgi:transcriptional regulator with XRE-family HTH domain